MIWSSLHKKWYPKVKRSGEYIYAGAVGYERADTLVGLALKVARVRLSRYLQVGRRW